MTTDSTAQDANSGPPWEVVEPAATEQAASTAPSTALAVFDPIERTLAEIEARHKDVVYDLTTTKGNEAARKARKELVSVRTAADDVYKTWNQPILAAQEKARALRDGFKDRVKLIEDPLDKAIDADEKRRAAEKKARDEAEAARIKAIRDRIASIYAQPAACAGLASSEIELSIVGVECTMTDKAFFEELQGEAEAAADVVLTKLNAMMSAAKASEERAEAQRLEAERLAAERAELERQRAELAAQQEAARIAAEQAETARLAAIAAEDARLANERAIQEAAERQRAADALEQQRLAQEAIDAAARKAADALAEQQRQLDERRAQFAKDQEKAKTELERAPMDDAPAGAAPSRVEHISESGAKIVRFVQVGVAGSGPAPSTTLTSTHLADAASEESRPPITEQTDAFDAERQAEAARAAALPKPPVKRPDDERLTAAVAKAFEVEPAIAAEWLGTYDAFEEIARLQGVPA